MEENTIPYDKFTELLEQGKIKLSSSDDDFYRAYAYVVDVDTQETIFNVAMDMNGQATLYSLTDAEGKPVKWLGTLGSKVAFANSTTALTTIFLFASHEAPGRNIGYKTDENGNMLFVRESDWEPCGAQE